VVWVYAAKNGYELVNAEELRKAAVTGRSPLNPLKVVLCPEGRLYENQMAYYRIARDAKLESYRRRMAALEKEGREKEALLLQMARDFNVQRLGDDSARILLQAQLQAAQQQARELADRFVTVNLDDQGETYQRAFRLFLAGDIDGAIRVMDSVDLKGGFEHDAALRRKATAIIAEMQAAIDTADERTRQRVEQTILSARMHKLQYRFQGADSLYAMALQYNPDTANLDIAGEYARFLYDQNQFGRARNLYTGLLGRYRLLAAGQPEAHLPDVARTLNSLGTLLWKIGDFAGAREDYAEALKIRRELARKNPDAHLPDVTMTLNNLGNLRSDIGDFAGAREDYTEALEIRRELARKNPDAHLPDLAATLNNLGILRQDIGDLAGAREDYTEALEIQRELSRRNPDAHLPDMAMTLGNLGVLRQDIGDLAGAREDYTEALKIRRELARQNPDVYLPSVAKTLNNLGVLLYAIGDLAGGRADWEEALTIYRELARQNPDAYLPDVAMTLNNLGILHRDIGDLTGGRADWEEALKIYRELARQNPDAYLPDVAMTLNNLGVLRRDIGDLTGARENYAEALKIRRELARKNPGANLSDLAQILNNLGVLRQDIGNHAGAREDYEEGVKIFRELARKNPDAYLPGLAATLNNLGALLWKIGDFAEAQEDIGEALEIRRELARKNPDAHLPGVAQSLHSLGILTLAKGEPEQVLPQIGEALEIREQLFRKNPTADGDDAGESAVALAMAHHALLDATGDLQHRAQGLDLLAKARDFLAVYQEPVIPRVLQLRRETDSLSQEFQSYDPEDRAIRERLRLLSAAVEAAPSPHEKVLRQEALLRELEAMRTQYPRNGSLTSLIAKEQGDLAWHHLLDRDFPSAEASARKGLQLTPAGAWIQARLALALIFQGKWDKAREACLRLKEHPQGDATPAKAFLEDLDALEKAGITHPDVPKARQLLR
jgi:Tfp pilus assembly protein PilF